MAEPTHYSLDDDYDIATDWPMTGSYTTPEGLIVNVYKAAHAVVSSNPYTARPKRSANVIGV